MAILNTPAALKIAAATFGLQPKTQTFADKLKGSTQTREQPGAVWVARLTIPPLTTEADWRELSAWIAEMAGQAGRVYFGPPQAAEPLGTATGALVNGADQTGKSLVVDAMGAGKTLLKGDYFCVDTSVGRELKIMTADATADGSGNATLNFMPQIRTSPADNATITVSSPTCIMRFPDDAQGLGHYEPGITGTFNLDLVESFKA